MNTNPKITLFFLIVSGALLACSSITGILGGGASGDILYEEDFSYVFSGWPRWEDEFSSTDYVNFGYEIAVYEADYIAWATAGETFRAADVQVDVTFIQGEFDSYFGIVCQHVDFDNFYVSVIASDGYFGVFKTVNAGPLEILGSSEFMDYSDAINQGLDTNQLRAVCGEGAITLYANGEQLVEVFDDQFTSGDVGLFVGTISSADTNIFFDNFVVRVP